MTQSSEARAVRRVVRGMPTSDGAGVKLTRVIGQPQLPDLDPFLMLDEFGTEEPQDYIAGFPDHPHRGFETVTYMLDGRMRHRDNHGNEGVLVPGSVQWMTAGRVAGVAGPISQPATDPTYLDVALHPGAQFVHTLPPDYTAFLYVFEGAVQIGAPPHAATLRAHELAVLGDGAEIRLTGESAGANGESARAILVAGQALREPVAKYGPFVMNTREELQQAFVDFQNGRF